MSIEKEGEGSKDILNDSNSQNYRGHNYRSTIKHEEITVDDLNLDIEKKLQEQGVIFDKKKFYVEDRHMTFGEKLADSVARVGGSWRFIIGLVAMK